MKVSIPILHQTNVCINMNEGGCERQYSYILDIYIHIYVGKRKNRRGEGQYTQPAPDDICVLIWNRRGDEDQYTNTRHHQTYIYCKEIEINGKTNYISD